MEKLDISLADIVKNFAVEGEFLSGTPYGDGHINDTYAVDLIDKGSKFRILLQRINHDIFRDVDALMKNIYGITEHLKKKILADGGDPSRETLNIIKTSDESIYYLDENRNYWRMYVFIEGATTHQKVRHMEDVYNCGLAFGKFQSRLSDYDPHSLFDTIPNFHNTLNRYEIFQRAIADDVSDRVKDVSEEIDFALSRIKFVKDFHRWIESGRLPYRVTHNDTKLNNIMIDDVTGKGICVIDLDTVMLGLVAYDFGDFIRFAANTAEEDERDLSKVNFSLEVFDSYCSGYLSDTKDNLTKDELESLPIGAILMTLECGVRFLTDHLDGDKYFKIHRENHNLDRCRTQFKLVKEMEKSIEKMQDILQKY